MRWAARGNDLIKTLRDENQINESIKTSYLLRMGWLDKESLILHALNKKTLNKGVGLNDGKRRHSDGSVQSHDSRSVALYPVITDTVTTGVHYVSIGNYYIQGMMNGRARAF